MLKITKVFITLLLLGGGISAAGLSVGLNWKKITEKITEKFMTTIVDYCKSNTSNDLCKAINALISKNNGAQSSSSSTTSGNGIQNTSSQA